MRAQEVVCLLLSVWFVLSGLQVVLFDNGVSAWVGNGLGLVIFNHFTLYVLNNDIDVVREECAV